MTLPPVTPTQIEWAPILSDIEAAEKFRRGHGGGYDREVAMLTAAFARHRLSALREGIRIGLEASKVLLCHQGHWAAADIISRIDPDTLIP